MPENLRKAASPPTRKKSDAPGGPKGAKDDNSAKSKVQNGNHEPLKKNAGKIQRSPKDNSSAKSSNSPNSPGAPPKQPLKQANTPSVEETPQGHDEKQPIRSGSVNEQELEQNPGAENVAIDLTNAAEIGDASKIEQNPANMDNAQNASRGHLQQRQQQQQQHVENAKTQDSLGTNRVRKSVDAKKPVRWSPPAVVKGSLKKQKSPNKPVVVAKQGSSNGTVEVPREDKQHEHQEHQERDGNARTDNPPMDEHQQQQQQQQPKLVNSNGLNLLKLARASHIAGDSPLKAIDYASRAATLFEKEDGEQANLELVLCLHIVAAGYCRLGRYDDAIQVLESSIVIPNLEQGSEHALAVFAGHMQLGDTLTLVGKYEKALASYHNALQVQKQVLGDMDPRVAETCRYLSEAHLQAMQFVEAQELCEHVLDIHSKHSVAGSIDEAKDRKLMALIHSGKGEHEMALEHLVLASTSLSCNGQDIDVASVDCGIGEAYFALGRYDEAVFSYQKALTILKSAKGDSHAAVASVYVSLADLYLKTGKQREAKTYCENAVRIFGKHNAGHAPDELSSGLVEVAGVYEAMGEHEQALSLLRRALDILQDTPGEQSAAAGVEAQIGVLLYVMSKFSEAYAAFKNAVSKLRLASAKETTFLGILFNQMGLASVELYDISTALEHFEEARRILAEILGPRYPDTLAVCSNLAGCYDALGRVDDAISLLEYIVEVKEESLGTVHPDVARERERLLALLKGVGRSRTRKTSTLEELLSLPNAEAAIT